MGVVGIFTGALGTALRVLGYLVLSVLVSSRIGVPARAQPSHSSRLRVSEYMLAVLPHPPHLSTRLDSPFVLCWGWVGVCLFFCWALVLGWVVCVGGRVGRVWFVGLGRGGIGEG